MQSSWWKILRQKRRLTLKYLYKSHSGYILKKWWRSVDNRQTVQPTDQSKQSVWITLNDWLSWVSEELSNKPVKTDSVRHFMLSWLTNATGSLLRVPTILNLSTTVFFIRASAYAFRVLMGMFWVQKKTSQLSKRECVSFIIYSQIQKMCFYFNHPNYDLQLRGFLCRQKHYFILFMKCLKMCFTK